MKKALAFIAVAAIAATTQAVTVEWKSGAITTPDGKANASGRVVTAMLYLIDSSTYSALDLSTAEKEKTAINTYLAKTADASATSNKNGYASPTTDIDAAKTGIANSQYAVIIYSYGSGSDTVYKIGKATDYLNGLGVQEGTAANIASQGSGWQSVSVPEPTTVALLALGLAAVGLKRKLA